MLFCLLGRAVATFPLGVISNMIKKSRRSVGEHKHLLSWKHMFMMWHAGLRGGIALVLTLELKPWVNEINPMPAGYQTARETLRNATILVICTFLLIFGGTTEIFLKLLGVPLGDEREDMTHKDGCFRQNLKKFKYTCLYPVLVGDRSKHVHMEGGVVRRILKEGAEFEGDQRDDCVRHPD